MNPIIIYFARSPEGMKLALDPGWLAWAAAQFPLHGGTVNGVLFVPSHVWERYVAPRLGLAGMVQNILVQWGFTQAEIERRGFAVLEGPFNEVVAAMPPAQMQERR